MVFASPVLGQQRIIEPSDRHRVVAEGIQPGEDDAEPIVRNDSVSPVNDRQPEAQPREIEDRSTFVQTIRRAPGERYLVQERNFDNFFITNPNVISATVRESGIEVSFIGRGTSELQIQDGDRTRSYRFVTTSVDLDSTLQELRQLLTRVIGVEAERVEDKIVVSGQIITQDDLIRYERIIERFDVLDLVERRFLEVEEQRLLEGLREVLRDRGLDTVRADLRRNRRGEPFVLLTGVAYTDRQLSDSTQLARSYFDNVTNQITLEKPEIQLDVILVTFDLDQGAGRGRREGPFSDIRMRLGSSPGADDGVTLNAVLGGGVTNWAGQNLFGQILDGETTLRFLKNEKSVINYVEAFSVVKSGETAYFQDGGEVIIPLVGRDNVGLASIDTGLILQMTPVVEENLKITTRISLTYNTGSETFSGGTENDPGTMSRRTARSNSTITAENGQTIVVSGSNTNLYEESKRSTPLLERIPIVNLFFKTKNRVGGNTRSFFFVTPRAPTLYRSDTTSIAAHAEDARRHYQTESQYSQPDAGFWLGYDQYQNQEREIQPHPWEKTED